MIKLFRRAEFQHLYTPHNEKPFLRSTFEQIWEAEPTLLDKTCSRFREDTNLNIFLMRYWQLASNKFYPTEVLNKKKVIQLEKKCLPDLKRMLFDKDINSFCINDSSDCSYEDYQMLKPLIVAMFEEKFPKKSTFER